MKSIVIYVHSGGGGMPGRLRETVPARRSRASFPQPARHSSAPIRSGGVTALRGSSSSRKPPPPPPATRGLCFSTVCDIRKEIKPKTITLHSLSSGLLGFPVQFCMVMGRVLPLERRRKTFFVSISYPSISARYSPTPPTPFTQKPSFEQEEELPNSSSPPVHVLQLQPDPYTH